MAEVTEKSIIVNGVDKCLVSELKRVYGSVEYQGAEYVFLQFPIVGDTVREYRPDSYTTAVELGDEICEGQTFHYHVTAIYFKLPEYSAAGYWNDISEAAPDTDFIIYNIPQLAGTALTMSLLRTMLLNGRVAGVKNSSMPVQDIQMFKAEAMKTREDFIVFNGPDEQLVSGLAMGADGGIGGTYGAMPQLFLKIYDLVSENRMAEARAIQYDADEIIYKLCSGTCNMYAMIKEVLRVSRGIDIGGVRKPLTDLCDGDRAIAGEAAAMIEAAKEKYC